MIRKNQADQDQSSRISRLQKWAKEHLAWTIAIASLILLLLVCGIIAALAYKNPVRTVAPQIGKTVKPEVKKPAYFSPLNGLAVASAADQTAPVTAVMIENSPDARPQSGLQQADVVYEAIAEGGITRFLVLYQASAPELIGPVRSVRLYDLEWLAPYQGSLAHVGGSARALQVVRSGGAWRDLDQFFNAGSYWRVSDRSSPHNVYTTTEKLHSLEQAKGFSSSEFSSFPRVDGAASKTANSSQVDISFSSANYNTSYQWDAATNRYARSQAGAPHLDREKGQISPSVIIAMHVNESTVLEDGYREQIETTGSGQAEIFQNGTVTEATWSKASTDAPLRLLDAAGSPISLVRGQTWIAAVPNQRGGVSWK